MLGFAVLTKRVSTDASINKVEEDPLPCHAGGYGRARATRRESVLDFIVPLIPQ